MTPAHGPTPVRPSPPARWSLDAVTTSAAGTRALAGSLAPFCRVGDVILLVGDLGSGKTTFAQGFAEALGVTGPVTSPTFTLVRQYPCPGAGSVRQFIHADVYRLDTLAEVEDLGLAELVEAGGVAVVEWGERAAPALGASVLVVTIGPGPDDGGSRVDEVRVIAVEGHGPEWAERHPAISEALGTLAEQRDEPR